MSATVEKRVREVIIDTLGVKPEKIEPKSSLTDNLGADSLDTVDVVMSLEKEFKIEISNEDAEKLLTVGDIIDYIKKRLKKQTE